MVRARMWTADKRMPLGVPRVGEGLKGGRMKKGTGKENPQHKRSLPQCSLMDPFKSYLFRQAYKDVEKLGDRLAEVEPLINWEKFRPILQGLFDNQGLQGGRPNVDPVLMVKLLVLQRAQADSIIMSFWANDMLFSQPPPPSQSTPSSRPLRKP